MAKLSSFPTLLFIFLNFYIINLATILGIQLLHGVDEVIMLVPIELYKIIQFHNVLTNTIYKLYANYGRQVYYVIIIDSRVYSYLSTEFFRSILATYSLSQQ